MKKYSLKTSYRKILADTITPVSIYLKLRDKYPNSILLESSDYHGNEDIYSYICCQSIAGMKVENGKLEFNFPDGTQTSEPLTPNTDMPAAIGNFANSFETTKLNFPFITGGIFGYCAYDAVRYFEEIEINTYQSELRKIPDIQYHVYRYIIVFNHFNNEVFLIENTYGENQESEVDKIEGYIRKRDFATYKFNLIEGEESNFTDDEFLKVLQKGVDHCMRGDVFQIVLSRRFSRQYNGDDFNVYRSLRSINPSPYLFYFDYGSFRIFGSSPEAQIVVKNGKSTIYPIAGTFRRTGDDSKDYDLAKKLLNDPKENAEHVMLVDLARNDLSRHCEQVQVETLKEVQYYSHVIHLVSKVTGQMHEKENFAKIVGDTFPAGTLSGAPKHSAMQIINRLEHGNRGFYGGCIGFMGFNGEFNSAIMIRSILSKDNVLYYQAGAGVVALSSINSELQEVNNKLAALKKAIEEAEQVA
ncbi:MAG TPA: anthranilate synthase component I family protein [Cytophagaceae bacterium]|nr:anthranilate synthase component I family protein [Cytophagaceae bacterium]